MSAERLVRSLRVLALAPLALAALAVAPGRCTPIPVEPPADCPTAVIRVAEGPAVAPLTVLHLQGDRSHAAAGLTIARWEWSVTQPPGSAAAFVPSASSPNPTFTADVAGLYTFRLTVRDDAGVASCSDAEVEVTVLPGGGLHVELLWSTPGDLDETDAGPEAGADLDLHLVHALAPAAAAAPDVDGNGAPDPWYDPTYDCFWFNPHPDWGQEGAANDPSLDRDDTDGAGPENISLASPEPGVAYRLAVHVWNDHGYGPSTATVRVWLHGLLLFEAVSAPLEDGTLWFVGTVVPSTGAVLPCDEAAEGPCETLDYHHPSFF